MIKTAAFKLYDSMIFASILSLLLYQALSQ